MTVRYDDPASREAQEIAHNLRRIRFEEGRGTAEDCVAWVDYEIHMALMKMLEDVKPVP